MIERAYIHVAGPELAGKTNLIEAILGAGAPICRPRCSSTADGTISTEFNVRPVIFRKPSWRAKAMRFTGVRRPDIATASPAEAVKKCSISSGDNASGNAPKPR